MRRVMPVAAVAVAAVVACAKAPPSLSPAGVRAWQVNEAVVALGTVQRAAIALNDVDRCETDAAGGQVCSPLLSDAATRAVVVAVTTALPVLRVLPAGWREAALAALADIEAALDASGRVRLLPYVQAARAVVKGL